MSRRLKNIGLFCRISSVLYVSFAKETYNLKEPTNRSHPIGTNTNDLARENVVGDVDLARENIVGTLYCCTCCSQM